MNIRFTMLVVTCCLLARVAAQAVPVTVNLGESAENFVEYGLGPNSNNLGTYAFDQGACAFDGTNTICTLSGAFSGSAPAFAAGTYTLVTKYAGNDRTVALIGTSIPGYPNFFNYTSASPSTTITLNLVTASGTFVQPVVAGASFDPAVMNFGFSFVLPYTCSGIPVASCTPELVGLTNGAILQSRVTTVVSFETSCAGDCDDSGEVTVSDLITMVDIALGTADVSTCKAGDRNGDRTIRVDEIIAAVNHALNGCGGH